MSAVETLTAEVHVLKIGTRQLTLSMVRQLDTFPINKEHITNFRALGRIRTGTKLTDTQDWGALARPHTPEIELIGTHAETGELMTLTCQGYQIKNDLERQYAIEQLEKPLIILGGMK
jgi:hypothetical protein